jgi:hypothetical protein
MALFLTLLDRFKNHIFYERKRMKKLALFLTDVKKRNNTFDLVVSAIGIVGCIKIKIQKYPSCE